MDFCAIPNPMLCIAAPFHGHTYSRNIFSLEFQHQLSQLGEEAHASALKEICQRTLSAKNTRSQIIVLVSSFDVEIALERRCRTRSGVNTLPPCPTIRKDLSTHSSQTHLPANILREQSVDVEGGQLSCREGFPVQALGNLLAIHPLKDR